MSPIRAAVCSTLFLLAAVAVSQPHPKPMAHQRLNGGFWRLDDEFTATLRIRNVLLDSSLATVPVVHFKSGTSLRLKPVLLAANQTVSLDIRSAIEDAGAAEVEDFGSISLEFGWPWPQAIQASVEDLNRTKSLVYDFCLAATLPHSEATQQLSGLLWRATDQTDAALLLTNTSSTAKEAKFVISDAGGAIVDSRAVLMAAGSVQRIALADVTSPAAAVTITYQGLAGDIIVGGMLEDQEHGFSAPIVFLEKPHSDNKNRQTIVPGMMVGGELQKMGLPADRLFTPYVYARNTGTDTLILHTRVHRANASTSSSLDLPPLTIPPNQIARIEMESATKGFSGMADVIFEYTGQQNQLQIAAASLDQSKSFVLGVKAQGVRNQRIDQVPFWHLGDSTDTMFSFYNPSAKDEDLVLTFRYQSGHYNYPVHVATHGSAMLNVSEVRAAQVPDDEGNIFSDSVDQGGAVLTSAKGSLDTFQTLMTNATFSAKYATCGEDLCTKCDDFIDFWLDFNPFSFPLNTSMQMTSHVKMGDNSTRTMTGRTQWSSENTNIASISYGGLANGVAAGAVTIDGFLASTSTGSECFVSGICDETDFQDSAGGTVDPVITSISKDKRLWYFAGNAPDPSFTLGSPTATLTANGATTGTFKWTITAGTSRLQLQGGSTTVTNTNSNTINITSTAFSTAANDVTVQLIFTPPNSTNNQTLTITFDIDSPYKLVSNGVTQTRGVMTTCALNAPNGTAGYQSTVPYKIMSFFGVQISNVFINESFTNIQNVIANNWGGFAAGFLLTPDGLFVDDICDVNQTNPTSLPPQSPLSSTLVKNAAQVWYVGSSTPAQGVPIQTDTLNRFRDHGSHTGITSPTR